MAPGEPDQPAADEPGETEQPDGAGTSGETGQPDGLADGATSGEAGQDGGVLAAEEPADAAGLAEAGEGSFALAA